ncbi:MAG: ABC transporter substrate-binding protein [Granulosicoccus sp.]|nr:ABC transporter substrate-binding protein [Granulosicoccus sp.]
MTGQNASAVAECGDVSIASMNWSSAEVIAEVDKLVLGEGYGCNAMLVAGDTLPTFTSMAEKGEPDLAPELWVNALGEQLNTAVANGKLVMAAEVLADGGVEGWWIPRYVADAHPDIRTASDALEHPELFPAQDDESRGALHNCPSAWKCQVMNRNLFRAYRAEDKGFELVDTGSAAGLDASIARAFERKEGWLGYYWAPAAMLGRYEMVRLDMGEHDRREWETCTAVPDCAEPRINGWARDEAFSVVTSGFADRAIVVMDYLGTRQWGNDTLNEVLAWMAANQATGSEAARYFLENYEQVWTEWVSPEVMGRVKAAL